VSSLPAAHGGAGMRVKYICAWCWRDERETDGPRGRVVSTGPNWTIEPTAAGARVRRRRRRLLRGRPPPFARRAHCATATPPLSLGRLSISTATTAGSSSPGSTVFYDVCARLCLCICFLFASAHARAPARLNRRRLRRFKNIFFFFFLEFFKTVG